MDAQEKAADFIRRLQDGGVYDVYMALPPAHQREYYQWVSAAKTPVAFQARLEKMRSMLRAPK